MNLYLRHFPWLLAFALSPIWFGGVTAMGTAVLGGLVGISLIWTSPEFGRGLRSRTNWGGLSALLLILFFPLIPLPFSWIEWAQPDRAALLTQLGEVTGEKIPDWMPLSLSPASTVDRIWECFLFLGVFGLARQLVADWSGHYRGLFIFITVTLLIITVGDYVFRLTGGKLWGFQEVKWGQPAGTFANRNHFAGWIVVAAIFTAGWVFRSAPALRFRKKLARFKKRRSRPMESTLIGAVLILATGQAMQTGSRGAALALIIGSGLALYLWIRSTQKTAIWVGLLIGLGAMALFWDATGSLVTGRFKELFDSENSQYPKMDLWMSAWTVFQKVHWLGSGWGTFLTTSNLFKQDFPDADLLHAENDYLELLVEAGWIGFLIVSIVAFLNLRPPAKQGAQEVLIREPEIHLFSAAAIGAFLIHAFFEFVSHIPANLILLALILGFGTGQADFEGKSMIRRFSLRRWVVGMGMGGLLVVGSTLQILAAFKASEADKIWSQLQTYEPSNTPSLQPEASKLNKERAEKSSGKLKTAIELWPAETKRLIYWIRSKAVYNMANAQQVETAADVNYSSTRQQILDFLRWDPYNWRIWLEIAWFDFTFSDNPEQWRRSGLKAIRFNPAQTSTALQFAEFFAERDQEIAFYFAQQTPPTNAEDLMRSLSLIWQIEPTSETLWSVTPETGWGLMTLSRFAESIQLNTLAVQACWRAKDLAPTEELVTRLIELNRPQLAEELIPAFKMNAEMKLKLARAYFQTGANAQSTGLSSQLWLREPWGLWDEADSQNTVSKPVIWAFLPEYVKKPEGWEAGMEQDCVRFAIHLARKKDFQEADLAALQKAVEFSPENLDLRRALMEGNENAGRFSNAALQSIRIAEILLRSR